jgi:membrane-bound inhibitor of C-type lysozyme
MAATFFITQPGTVYLKWANTSITLSQVQSDVGTRYIGKDVLGSYSFWQTDNTAVFQKPGSGTMSCTAEPTG